MAIAKFGFSQKLLLSMLVIGLVPLLVSSWLLTEESNKGLEQQVFAQLDSIREIKRKQLESYFSTINSQITTFAENDMVIEATQELTKGFNSLEPNIDQQNIESSVEDYYKNQFGKTHNELADNITITDKLFPASTNGLYAQYLYISENKSPLGSKLELANAQDGSSYSENHEYYHPKFSHFLSEFGYYDIFLVDIESGNVVYSVFKEIDYATSLKNGPHANSGLAQAYKKSINAKLGSTQIVDFQPYLPSYEAAASFISSPIYDGADQIGVLIFQMPVERINAIALDSTGLGDTGETYLVGNDLLMRSQSRLYDSKTLGVLEVDTESSAAALSGKSGRLITTDYRGKQVLSSFAPLDILGLSWAILTDIDVDEAFAVSNRLFRLSTIMASICIVSIFVVTWMVLKSTLRQLGAPPERLSDFADAIANDRIDVGMYNVSEKAVGVYRQMSDMRDKLQERTLSERKAAAENTQIKTAVDNATNNILFADADMNITYFNESYLRFLSHSIGEFKVTVPSLELENINGTRIENYHPDPIQFRQQLLNLTKTEYFDTTFGSLYIRITATPVRDTDGNRIGTVTEWSDRTQEVRTETEIQGVVNKAQCGDLSQRISLEGKKEFFLRLGEDVNKLMNVCDRVIVDTVNAVDALAKGDLTYKIDNAYSGSFAKLKDGVNNTSVKLTEILQEIAESSEMVRASSKDIAGGNLNLSHRTELQAANIENTASSMQEMTAAVQQNASNLSRANSLANNTQKQAIKGGNVVSDTVIAMSDITDSSNKISEIIGVIDEIAFQTNLLALNASVEAARAGSAGLGFAVVADEVRNLAGRSSNAAKEIKNLIQDSVTKVQLGTNLADQSGQSLKSIVESINELSEVIGHISTASQEQSLGIAQVNHSIGEMDEVTQQNVALVEEASAAANVLSGQADSLRDLVNYFTIQVDWESNYEAPQNKVA